MFGLDSNLIVWTAAAMFGARLVADALWMGLAPSHADAGGPGAWDVSKEVRAAEGEPMRGAERAATGAFVLAGVLAAAVGFWAALREPAHPYLLVLVAAVALAAAKFVLFSVLASGVAYVGAGLPGLPRRPWKAWANGMSAWLLVAVVAPLLLVGRTTVRTVPWLCVGVLVRRLIA